MTWPLANLAAALRGVALALSAPHAAWCALGTAQPVLATRREGADRVVVLLPWGASDDVKLWGARHPRMLVRRAHLTPLTPAAAAVLLAERT